MSVGRNQPLTIHQFHYRASAGEAVTRHMLFIQEALAECGIGGKIFSVQRKNLPQGKIQPWSLDSVWDCDLLLIHHSQFNPTLKELLGIEIPKALVYHSQPPEHYFSHDLEAKKNIQRGRNQLALIKKMELPTLGVSQFSLSELQKKAGIKTAGILPLMHLEDTIESNDGCESGEPKHFLFVGKLFPHKKQSALIETFHHLKQWMPPKSTLHLVGTGDPLYTKYLKLLIKQLDLNHTVNVTGKITEANLSEYYRMADAFVCLSEYEGFCLPVVEAMKHGVPVFYRPLTGIKETMGGAGVELLTDNPIKNAVIIQKCLENKVVVKAILAAQKVRIKELSGFQNRAQVQKVMMNLCGRNIESSQKPSSFISKRHETSLSI